MRILADTHAAIWYLWKPEKLSSKAVTAIDESLAAGERIGISTVTLCEVIYLVERQRIRSDAFELLLEAIHASDGLFEEVPLDSDVATFMRMVPASIVRDMPNRIIAASALARRVPLITKDQDVLDSGIPTIW